MSSLGRIKSGVTALLEGNFYSFRRSFLWPEDRYKRIMLKRIQRIYRLDYFVETGTYLGQTIFELQSMFRRLWTIEIDDRLFDRASRKLARFSNVSCLHGDSGQLLLSVVTKLDGPALFWLDGHYSGGITGKGDVSSPIITELEHIRANRVNRHTIVIDDMSEFRAQQGNAPLSSVVAAVERINPQFKIYFDYDMLIALPSEPYHRMFWRDIAPPFVVR